MELSGYLKKKENKNQKQISELIKYKTELLKPKDYDYLLFEKPINIETEKRNLLRQEFNKKLQLRDETLNHLTKLILKLIEKMIVLYIQQNSIIGAFIFVILIGILICGSIITILKLF